MRDPQGGQSPRRPRREAPAEGETERETPFARLRRRLDRRPAVVSRGSGGRAEVALTFDDGPSRWSLEIADAFEAHGCRATFFMRGAAVEEEASAAASIAAAGHELGNHLWSHTDASQQSSSEIRTEIRRTDEAIRAATGIRPRLVRPPYCKAPLRVAEAARRAGIRAIVLRSIGSSDWAAESADQIVAPLLEAIQAGDIVCMHDGVSPDERDTDSRQPTAEAVGQLVPALLERGLRPVTVSRMLR